MHFAAVAPFSFPMFNFIIEPGSCNVGVVQCVTNLAAHASAWDIGGVQAIKFIMTLVVFIHQDLRLVTTTKLLKYFINKHSTPFYFSDVKMLTYSLFSWKVMRDSLTLGRIPTKNTSTFDHSAWEGHEIADNQLSRFPNMINTLTSFVTILCRLHLFVIVIAI